MNAVNEWRVSHRNENVVPVLRAHGAELALEAAEAATLLCTPSRSLSLSPSLPLPPAPARSLPLGAIKPEHKQTNKRTARSHLRHSSAAASPGPPHSVKARAIPCLHVAGQPCGPRAPVLPCGPFCRGIG
jgi:hypothetical protein